MLQNYNNKLLNLNKIIILSQSQFLMLNQLIDKKLLIELSLK